MLRLGMICGAFLVSAPVFADDVTPKPSTDVTLTLTAAEQGTWAQVGPVLDACIGAATIRGDASSCKAVSQYLAAFAAKVAAAVPAK